MSDDIRPDIKPRSKMWQRTFIEAIKAGESNTEAKRLADAATTPPKEGNDEPDL